LPWRCLWATLGVARAAAPWSDPQAISGSFSSLSFDAAGHGALFGLAQTPGQVPVNRVIGVSLDAGVPGPMRESKSRINLTALRLYGRDGVVAAGDSSLRRGAAHHVSLTRGHIGAPLSRPQSLRGRSRVSFLLDLAVNLRGDAVAAVRWCRTTACGGTQTLVVYRWRRGARLGKPVRIARGRKVGAGVGLNARGDVALVWDRLKRPLQGGARDVYGQILRAGGALRPRQRLGSASSAPRYRISLTNTLRVVAGWVAQQVNECFANPGEIAIAQAQGGRFSRAQQLAKLEITGCGRYVSGPGVAFARRPDGSFPVAWSGNEGGRWVVRAGELGAAGVTGATVVSDRATDAVLADLAVGPRGEAIMLLGDGVGGADPTGPQRLLAVTREAAAGPFGTPELVADKANTGDVEIDPGTRRPTVIYPDTTPTFEPATALVMRDPVGP
jgi:hypothetical protein